VVAVLNAQGRADIVLVCEHSSNYIPDSFDGLGLTPDARSSHAAWDPGAEAVASAMAWALDAPLVVSRVSRLVYDCNRPPEAPDAMPARSEIHNVPGNANLSPEQRQARVRLYYEPFRETLARTLADRPNASVVTLHSFTPVYLGVTRSVEIGLLHDADARLVDALLETAPRHTCRDVRRNAPYGPQDGVTHTLRVHALPEGRRNVMIEIRNDLIRTEAQQQDMARCLSGWVTEALAETEGMPCGA
jgi:predicted N-formylglutamate amidohydrolase